MNKKILYAILISIFALHIILVLISMAQPFEGDEVIFSECAKNYADNGKPSLIQSQFHNATRYPDLDKQYHFSSFHSSCLGHPPFYITVLAAFISIFGQSDYSLRMLQAIFGLFSVFLVFLISRKIFEESPNKDAVSLIAAALYALNPLVVQSSIITDIDGGTLNFFTLLFVYFFISQKNFYYLVPALTLIIWNKFTTPIILFGALALYFIIQRDWKGAGKNIILFALAGISFIISFWIFSHLLNVNFLDPFANIFSPERVSSSRFTLSSMLRSAWSLKIFIYFASPFLLALFSIFSIKFYSSIYKKLKNLDSKEKLLLFINFAAIITILFYAYLGANAWGFPKYYISAMAPICIFIASFITSELPKLNKSKISAIAILYILLVIFMLIFLKDPLLPEFDSTASNIVAASALLKVSVGFAFYSIIPFIITFFLASWISKKKIIASLSLLLVFFYVYINAVQAITGYSSYYRYGDTGILETVQYFKDNNISANQVASYPNIGYYLDIKNYYEITFVYKTPEDFKKYIIENPEINYIAIYERDIVRIGEDNMKHFGLKEKIGSYYIYEKNGI
jgi:4-amino-4-deoxy-L-arabinose transferase-like glycosyltransferase